MGFDRFKISLMARLALLFLCLTALSAIVFVLEKEQMLFSILLLVLLIIIQLASLYHFLGSGQQEFAKFVEALKHGDTSLAFSERSKGLYPANDFNRITRLMQDIKDEAEARNLLMHQLTEQLNTGIIVVKNGDIILMNTAAQKLLDIHKLKSWKQLADRRPVFARQLEGMKLGGQKVIELPEQQLSLALHLSKMELLGIEHRIITIFDLKQSLAQKETEAWIRLIRVLNHEIMNSVTPISSLSETIMMILNAHNKEVPDREAIEDIRRCTQTIRERSESLYSFVTEYKKLTKIPEPKTQSINTNEFIENIRSLLSGLIEKDGVRLEILKASETSFIHLDRTLMEQVFINLVKNSLYALRKTNQGIIRISAIETDESIVLEVADNGCGIEKSLQRDVFIPFFTTRDDGSGIGLSLSAQIVRMHQAAMTLDSDVGAGCRIRMEFFNS